MKLDDKQKKWMIIGGAVIVCMILVDVYKRQL